MLEQPTSSSADATSSTGNQPPESRRDSRSVRRSQSFSSVSAIASSVAAMEVDDEPRDDRDPSLQSVSGDFVDVAAYLTAGAEGRGDSRSTMAGPSFSDGFRDEGTPPDSEEGSVSSDSPGQQSSGSKRKRAGVVASKSSAFRSGAVTDDEDGVERGSRRATRSGGKAKR